MPDASAAVEALLDTPAGLVVIDRTARAGEPAAPAHMPVEVAQVLRRLEHARVVERRRAAQAVEDLRDLDVAAAAAGICRTELVRAAADD